MPRRRRTTPTELVPIRTRELTKDYGDLVAVDHLNLEVQAGEIFGLLGQNGAGKTTTILMLLGLTEPTSGQARVVGLDPARKPLEVKRRVGYMPDAVGFYTDLTGRENLRYTARLNRIPSSLAESTIDEVLEQVGLMSRADDPVETYSRGMLQRLGIADALVKDPDVLILDEPTTAIDPLGVVEILDLLRRLVRERGHGRPALEPPAEPGPVGLRPDRDLRLRPDDRHRARSPSSPSGSATARAHVEVGFDRHRRGRASAIGDVLRAIDGVASATPGRRPGDPWTLAVGARRRRGRRPPSRAAGRRRARPPARLAPRRRAVARGHLPPRGRPDRVGPRRSPVTAPAAPIESAPAPRPAPSAPCLGPAGWSIARKEFADHILSARFLVLLLLLGVVAAIPLYLIADVIRSAASDASGGQAIFIALFWFTPPVPLLANDTALPSVAGFLGLVAPLLGLAFGFDAVNGERAQGTLPRLLSQPIHRDDVINGKFAAGLSVIGLVLVAIVGTDRRARHPPPRRGPDRGRAASDPRLGRDHDRLRRDVARVRNAPLGRRSPRGHVGPDRVRRLVRRSRSSAG